MNRVTGEKIDLSISLKKNGIPVIGKEIKAKVFDLFSKQEILPSTVLPEVVSIPALYSFLWSPPRLQTSIVIEYDTPFGVKKEFLTIGSPIVIEQDNISAEIEEEEIKANVEEEIIKAEIEDEEIEASIDEDEIKVEIECDD